MREIKGSRGHKAGLASRADRVGTEASSLFWDTRDAFLMPADKRKIRAIYNRAAKIVNEASLVEYVPSSAMMFETKDLRHAAAMLREAKEEEGLHTRRALNLIRSAMNAVQQFAAKAGVRDASRSMRDPKRRPKLQQEMFRASETVSEIGKPPKQVELFRTEGAVRLTEQPRTYLSKSAGRYRVVHDGMQLASDKPSVDEALASARHYKLTVSPYMWDGDKGSFVRRTSGDASRRRAFKRRTATRTRRGAS